MSDLDDFMNEGLTISSEIMGETEFTIDGRPLTGVLNEFEGEQEIELGGLLGTYNATLVCPRAQFRFFGSPLTRTLKSKIVEIDGVKYSIKRIANDSVSVSLGLIIAR